MPLPLFPPTQNNRNRLLRLVRFDADAEHCPVDPGAAYKLLHSRLAAAERMSAARFRFRHKADVFDLSVNDCLLGVGADKGRALLDVRRQAKRARKWTLTDLP